MSVFFDVLKEDVRIVFAPHDATRVGVRVGGRESKYGGLSLNSSSPSPYSTS